MYRDYQKRSFKLIKVLFAKHVYLRKSSSIHWHRKLKLEKQKKQFSNLCGDSCKV